MTEIQVSPGPRKWIILGAESHTASVLSVWLTGISAKLPPNICFMFLNYSHYFASVPIKFYQVHLALLF